MTRLKWLIETRFVPTLDATGSTVVDPQTVDHTVGLELQIVDVVERSRRAQVQGDSATEAALDDELEALHSELSDAATDMAVRNRPLEERRVAIEVETADLDAVAGRDFGARREVLRREVAAQGGEAMLADDAGRYGARFHVAAPDLAAALDQGIEAFHQVTASAGLPHAPVVALEAPTMAELGDERRTVSHQQDERRLDLHNAAVDTAGALAHRCAATDLPTGRICTKPFHHHGSCRFLPRDATHEAVSSAPNREQAHR